LSRTITEFPGSTIVKSSALSSRKSYAGHPAGRASRFVDEFRTPYDSRYVAAIGRAIYIFAIYEWNIVHTMEKLRPGFLNKWRFARRPMTAGKVAKKSKMQQMRQAIWLVH
jgi:hypothetical protein